MDLIGGHNAAVNYTLTVFPPISLHHKYTSRAPRHRLENHNHKTCNSYARMTRTTLKQLPAPPSCSSITCHHHTKLPNVPAPPLSRSSKAPAPYTSSIQHNPGASPSSTPIVDPLPSHPLTTPRPHPPSSPPSPPRIPKTSSRKTLSPVAPPKRPATPLQSRSPSLDPHSQSKSPASLESAKRYPSTSSDRQTTESSNQHRAKPALS